MAWLALLGSTEGRKTGFAAVIGTTIGLALNGILAAAGLASILMTEPWLWTILRWAGAALMVWLANDTWRIPPSFAGPTAAIVPKRNARSYFFMMGALINLLNPKAFIFYVLIAPPFLPDGKLTFANAIVLTAISVLIATVVHALIVLIGDRANDWVSEPTRTRSVRRVLSIGLVFVAIWFLVSMRY